MAKPRLKNIKPNAIIKTPGTSIAKLIIPPVRPIR
jgi:hypothetical protein